MVLGRYEEGAFEEDQNHIRMIAPYSASYCRFDIAIKFDEIK